MKVDYRIDCKAVLPASDKHSDVIRDAAVLIKGNRIEWVGPLSELPDGIEAQQVLSYPHFACIPGLVNTHCHAAMVLLRGYGDDLALQEWLYEKVFPAEANLIADDVYWGTLLASAEMIRSGCTAFADMYFFMDSAAQAVADIGIRAALARSVAGVTDPDGAKLKESLDFAKRWNGVADGRIRALLSPHSLYTCSPEYVSTLIGMAKDNGLGIHTHLAETRREEEYAQRHYGMSTAEKMNQIGLFDLRTMAAHCIWLNDEQIDILAEKKVSVAHTPGSNTKLASGIAKVTKMREKGIVVGIGTDGASSNNNLDLMEEMRLASLLAKVSTLKPTALKASETLRMATADSARCIPGEADYGSIEAGKKADLVFIDTRASHMCPEHNLLSNIVYSASSSDVDTVFIDGRMVMSDRKILTIDEEEAKRQCETRAARLVEGV